MPNFNPSKPFGEKFSTDNDTQAGFVSLFAEYAMSGSPPQGEDLISELKETLTPAYLISPKIFQYMERLLEYKTNRTKQNSQTKENTQNDFYHKHRGVNFHSKVVMSRFDDQVIFVILDEVSVVRRPPHTVLPNSNFDTHVQIRISR